MRKTIRRPATEAEAKASTLKLAYDKQHQLYTVQDKPAFLKDGNPIYGFLRTCTNIQLAFARFHGLNLKMPLVFFDPNTRSLEGSIMDVLYIPVAKGSTFGCLAEYGYTMVLKRLIDMTSEHNVMTSSEIRYYAQQRRSVILREADENRKKGKEALPAWLKGSCPALTPSGRPNPNYYGISPSNLHVNSPYRPHSWSDIWPWIKQSWMRDDRSDPTTRPDIIDGLTVIALIGIFAVIYFVFGQ